MPFRNRVVWITGASSGIGEALAYEFARQGAKLVLSARRADVLQQVKQRCVNSEKHIIIAFDMTDIDQLSTVVTEVEQQTGGVTHCI